MNSMIACPSWRVLNSLTGVISNRLRHHIDRPARTLRRAEPAVLAIGEVEAELLARPELDHRIVGARRLFGSVSV